jgi:hypothetical protein
MATVNKSLDSTATLPTTLLRHPSNSHPSVANDEPFTLIAQTLPELLQSVYSQQRRIVDYLQTHSTGLNRYEADLFLGICQLAPRIFELKAQGHAFDTVSETAVDLNGRTHRHIARYFWRGFKVPVRLACNDEVYFE